jgi:hypothetical protein
MIIKQVTLINRNRINFLLASSLLILFLGYYGSITLFYHSHLVLGTTLVHSHPYKSDPTAKPIHSHTDEGFRTIQFINCFIAGLLIIKFTFRSIAPVIFEFGSNLKNGRTNNTVHYFYLLRAPPSDMFG